MLLKYHTIYQLGAIAVPALTVKSLTRPKARPKPQTQTRTWLKLISNQHRRFGK